ncbi:MAG: rod shape determining protein RodA [Clostridiales bacterium]|nr:rod shape determining protein RodA [Clostridiales bacterium]
MFNFKQYNFKHYNFFLIIVVTITGILGANFVKLASGEELGPAAFKKQLIGFFLGLLFAVILSFFDYHFICKFVIIYYLIGVLLAAATKFSPIGTDLNTGSFRWIRLPGLNLQPSELCKLILILTLAVFFTKQEEYMDRFRTFIFGGILMFLPTGFILVQSDLSSSIVMMFIFAMMIFAAGLSYKIIAALLTVGVPASIAVFWYIQQPYQKLLNYYQQGRILGFKYPEKYTDIMYQQNYSYQAIASGTLIGKLFNNSSTATRVYRHADVTESDFIFAVIGEESGFLGSCLMIGLLALFVVLCLVTAKRASDRLGMLIAIGIGSMVMFQTFANIGVATRMLPNTGLPLPFVSAGLSSLMSCMIGVGLLLNIGLQSSRNRSGGFSMI